jgi:hypothetical protein
MRPCRVFKDMPLYPFARTLILNASNILVLAGLKGLPTPAACDLIMLYCKSLEHNGAIMRAWGRNHDSLQLFDGDVDRGEVAYASSHAVHRVVVL